MLKTVVIDRDLGLGLGLGRDRLFGGISVSAEIANFSAENRDKINDKKNMIFAHHMQVSDEKFISQNFTQYFLGVINTKLH